MVSVAMDMGATGTTNAAGGGHGPAGPAAGQDGQLSFEETSPVGAALARHAAVGASADGVTPAGLPATDPGSLQSLMDGAVALAPSDADADADDAAADGETANADLAGPVAPFVSPDVSDGGALTLGRLQFAIKRNNGRIAVSFWRDGEQVVYAEIPPDEADRAAGVLQGDARQARKFAAAHAKAEAAAAKAYAAVMKRNHL